MALVKCLECSREVSDKAAACPQCGAPVSVPTPQLWGSRTTTPLAKPKPPALLSLIVLIALAALAYAAFTDFGRELFYVVIFNKDAPPRGEARRREEPGDAIKVSGLHLQSGDYGSLSIAGEAKNTSSKSFGYAQVEINLFDDSGALTGSTLANINNFGPGQTWKFEAPIIHKNRPARFELKGVSAF